MHLINTTTQLGRGFTGHAEIHKWLDPRTKPRWQNKPLQLVVASPNNRDMVYLSEHASIPE
jgi:hypothetical protein